MHALRAGLWITAQHAWRGRRQTRCPAVADKVPPVEELDEGMFAVAGDGTRVAHGRRSALVLGLGIGRGRIAGNASEETLA